MTPTFHLLLLLGDLMTDNSALLFSMLLLCWMLTVGLMSKDLTENGWRANYHPFRRVTWILLQIHIPFAALLVKITPYLMLIPLPIPCPTATTLMTSQIRIPFRTTHAESFVFAAGISGTEQENVSHPSLANLHVPSLQIGRMASSSRSKPTNRSVSPTMSVDHATTAATHCMVNISAPSALMPNMRQPHAPGTDLAKILYKVVTPYISSTW